MSLKIAPGLELTEDFATQGTAIIGVRGSGKSNTEVRYAELLYAAGIPFVAVDPKGDWHGIRMEGTGPGLPIPVFGGLYGDFPLDESLGARIADLLVNENLSAVLDVSRLSKTVALPKFLTAFCNQLMDRHQQEPHVRCVILEEAHRYIPQNVTAKISALKEAAASLLLEGRAFGLGCWACTQRPARLHNDVLEEVDTAIIHRIGVTASADLARVRKWVEHEDLGPEIGQSLTKLKNGEAWVLSPVALEIVKRVQIDRRTTFDSGATPTLGTKRRSVATIADIDAPAIKEALSDAIEKADAEDPKKLKARIRELERQITQKAPATETVIVAHVPPSVAQLAPAVGMAMGSLLDEFRTALEEGTAKAFAEVNRIVEKIEAEVEEIASQPAAQPAAQATKTAAPGSSRSPLPGERAGTAPRAAGPLTVIEGLTDYDVGLLEELARRHPLKLTRKQLGAMAGRSPKSSAMDGALKRLDDGGYITRTRGVIELTDIGLTAVPIHALGEPASGAELADMWCSKLDAGAAAFLRVIVDAGAQGITRDEASERAGRSSRSSATDGALKLLADNGLIHRTGGVLVASDDLLA